MRSSALFTGLFAFGLLSPLLADVRLPSVFADHMVLQQGQKVAVWGWADEDEEVTVKFAGQEKKAKPDAQKHWKVELEAIKANDQGAELSVSGKNALQIKDVLVGEVWVCSGQSNMEWTVSKSKDFDAEKSRANLPHIRVFTVNKTIAQTPQEDCKGNWAVCSPETVGNFTAVGYFFGREIHQNLKLPVGILHTSWGGTPSEAWTSRPALEAEPAAKKLLERSDSAIKNYDEAAAKAAHEKKVAEWKAQEEKIKAENAVAGAPQKPLPQKPGSPQSPLQNPHTPASLSNGMLQPLIPYGIKGALWYQGESNAGRAYQYREIFPAMIKDWRARWGSELPFYFVQLANFREPPTAPGISEDWAELQEAQLLTLKKLPKTGMAVTNDIGEAKDIHPKNKQDVGRRLSLWALAQDYGKKEVIKSGPIFKAAKVEDGKIRVEFEHAEGLKSKDGGPLKQFQIAGEDKKFVWAEAAVEGSNVVVSSKEVAKPVAVRYAWDSNPEGANLTNKAELPASLFRSDEWPGVTADKD